MSVANLRQGVRDHHSEIHALAVADITCLRDRLMTSFAESEQLPDAVSGKFDPMRDCSLHCTVYQDVPSDLGEVGGFLWVLTPFRHHSGST